MKKVERTILAAGAVDKVVLLIDRVAPVRVGR